MAKSSIELFILETEQGILLRINVIPGSKQNTIVGVNEANRLKIKITSPPVEGKANKDIIKLLSKMLHIPKSSISIYRGNKSRNKDILIKKGNMKLINELFENFLN